MQTAIMDSRKCLTMSLNDDKDNDFEMARRVKHGLLAKGEAALDAMIEVARATEHPRAYEVLATMIKNVGDVSDSLIDIHKKKHDMEKSQAPAIPNSATTNNVFVGSTADLQKMLMKDVTPVEPNDE